MNVARVGAAGNAGPRLPDERLARGHQVGTTGRQPAKLGGRGSARPAPVEGDAGDGAALPGQRRAVAAR